MNMKIETLPGSRIAFVRQVGPYGPINAKAMERVKAWAAEKNLLTESAILFGIPQDNPATTPPEHCRYDACIVIANNYPIDESVNEGELPGGEYAVCVIQHTAEEIQKAWAEIFPALQRSEYQMDNKPIVERYTGAMLSQNLCEICVPIKPHLS
ncbi:AraC family transcriptional regulator [Cohnella soli]|uniref:GyrI-like domain-containing protein n=1 Tax=Cohnella soli TaxID=425005 RepID=A0ABW0HQ17_9BACL